MASELKVWGFGADCARNVCKCFKHGPRVEPCKTLPTKLLTKDGLRTKGLGMQGWVLKKRLQMLQAGTVSSRGKPLPKNLANKGWHLLCHRCPAWIHWPWRWENYCQVVKAWSCGDTVGLWVWSSGLGLKRFD